MNKFSSSIQGIDMEGLQMIKGMTNNVILLSLMDPNMLNSVLDNIEKKGGVFAELIKDFEDKKQKRIMKLYFLHNYEVKNLFKFSKQKKRTLRFAFLRKLI